MDLSKFLLTFNMDSQISAEQQQAEGHDGPPGFATRLAAGVAKRALTGGEKSHFGGLGGRIRDFARGVFSEVARDPEAMEKISATTAEMIREELSPVVDSVQRRAEQNTNEMIAAVGGEIDEKISLWDSIRGRFAPEGGFFKTLWARILYVGARVGILVGVIALEKKTGKKRPENSEHLRRIFAWMLGFGTKDDTSGRADMGKMFEKIVPILTPSDEEAERFWPQDGGQVPASAVA